MHFLFLVIKKKRNLIGEARVDVGVTSAMGEAPTAATARTTAAAQHGVLGRTRGDAEYLGGKAPPRFVGRSVAGDTPTRRRPAHTVAFIPTC